VQKAKEGKPAWLSDHHWSSSDVALAATVLAHVLLISKITLSYRALRSRPPASEDFIKPAPVAEAHEAHPYLEGNFAPVTTECALTPCTVIGTLPSELAGGQYVRNGGNPLFGAGEVDPEARFHWFDGDGMLAGVYFPRGADGNIRPAFVNAFVLTDVHRHARATPALRRPLVPSIQLFSDPLARTRAVLGAILRATALVVASRLRGARAAVRVLSVANTAVVFHDGRALATCESGPPMRVRLPALETVGWYDGARAENEPTTPGASDKLPFGAGDPLLGWMKQWTTAHVGALLSLHAPSC
jgi:hypothetical protein